MRGLQIVISGKLGQTLAVSGSLRNAGSVNPAECVFHAASRLAAPHHRGEIWGDVGRYSASRLAAPHHRSVLLLLRPAVAPLLLHHHTLLCASHCLYYTYAARSCCAWASPPSAAASTLVQPLERLACQIARDHPRWRERARDMPRSGERARLRSGGSLRRRHLQPSGAGGGQLIAGAGVAPPRVVDRRHLGVEIDLIN